MGKTVIRIGVGYRVGHLTVEEASGEKRSGYRIWRCRCDCGGEILLDTRYLQRGTFVDCGCMTRVKPGQRDLTGQRFGKIVCMEPTDRRTGDGSVIWRCRCDCGQECAVSVRQLLSGNKKSCGCLSCPPLKAYVGKRFGQLTVLEYAGKTAGMHRWRCRCDCGAETVVGQTLLQTGKTKSCGCLQGTIIRENLKLYEGTSVTILEAAKRRRTAANGGRYPGVYQNKRNGKWVAQITFKRKTYYLGSFDKLEDAVKARQRGEAVHDEFLEWYHQLHEKEQS